MDIIGVCKTELLPMCTLNMCAPLDFWSFVIQDLGDVIENQTDNLRYHLTKGGIPSPIRGLVWQMISKSRDLVETNYKQLLGYSSPFEKQITRDLTRTFPTHPYFMQESGRRALFNVAKAYSLFDQEVGYCQGLAFIIGCLLLHVKPTLQYLSSFFSNVVFFLDV